jgi:ribosomal protein S27E
MDPAADADDAAANADDDAAADAFALVGNEHRVAILRALLDAHADPETPYPTSFATLRDRAGVDVSAQFAYHLDALVGAFVARTDDGYRLRYPGWKAAAALAAGTYTDQRAFGPTPVPGECAHCRTAALHASYGDAWLTVACHGCERVLTRYPFPPGAAAAHLDATDERAPDVDALLAAFDDRVRSHFALAVDGVCPECAGRMRTALATVEDAPTDQTDTRGDGHAVQAVADCETCGNHLTLPVGCALLADPRTLALARDRGVDLVDRPYWRVPQLVDDARVERTDSSPLEATVSLDADATVTVTSDLDVRHPDD